MVKNSKASGWVFLLLFSLPFIGFGSGLGYSAVSCLVKWQAMKSWDEVPATIRTANLDVKHKTSHSNGSTSTSTTYKVTASYTYNYKDHSYRGNRVTMHSGSDSFSYHREIYGELFRCKESGQTFRCYVNPENPSEAILFRAPRWEKVYSYFALMLLFGGAGSGLFYKGLRNRHTKQQEDKLKALYPSESWLWKKEWRDGQISSHSKSKMFSAAAGALIWNLMASLGLILLYGEFRNGNYLVLIFLIFPAVGIGLAIWAVRLILHWFKFGQSTFEMQAVPGVIGGALRGRIHTKVNIKPQDGFHLTLSCINRVTTGSGKQRKTRENVRWQDTCDIAREMYEYDPSRSVIPVLFQIPYDCLETSDDNPKDTIFWRLKVSAKVPGVDYAATFEVPVFRTPESSKDFVLDKTSIAAYQVQPDMTEALEAEKIRVEELPSGGRSYYFAGKRNKVFILFSFLLFSFWSVVAVLILRSNGISVFTLVFALIDILFLFILLDSAFFRSNADVYPKSISITKRLLFYRNIQELDLDDIERFKIKSGSTLGSRLYYNLNVVAKDGSNFLIAKDLTNRRLAEHLAGEMEKVLLA
jgi:hypothetical protein